MDEAETNPRHEAVRLVEQFYRGELSLSELMQTFEECRDREINVLIDLVEHEPAEEGWLGVGPTQHEEYMAQVRSQLAKLRT